MSDDISETIDTGVAQVWDTGYTVDLVLMEQTYSDYTCPHVDAAGRLPRVVVATNEGGASTTGVCLDCLLEWVAAHGDLLRDARDGEAE